MSTILYPVFNGVSYEGESLLIILATEKEAIDFATAELPNVHPFDWVSIYKVELGVDCRQVNILHQYKGTYKSK